MLNQIKRLHECLRCIKACSQGKTGRRMIYVNTPTTKNVFSTFPGKYAIARSTFPADNSPNKPIRVIMTSYDVHIPIWNQNAFHKSLMLVAPFLL